MRPPRAAVRREQPSSVMPEATPDDPAAVLLKEFEALQEDLSSLQYTLW